MSKILESYQHIYYINKRSTVKRWMGVLSLLAIGLLFVPWTQNVRARGNVTALRQEQRPQQINTIIAGRIEKWYVKEGDYVHRGDTIVQLSEVKADYLDPDLASRTREQIDAKKSTISNYEGKVIATQ